MTSAPSVSLALNPDDNMETIMRLRSFVIAVSLLALFVGPVQAQTTLNTTALASAVTSTSQRSISLDSASNITANTNQLYVGSELMVVTSVNTTTNVVQVSRTGATSTHGVDDIVIITQPGSVVGGDLSGTCTTTATFRPTINANTSRLYDCAAGYWQERASTAYTVYRQEFDAPCFASEEADGTVELVSDGGENRAICPGGAPNIFTYRLDGAQATPFISRGGTLDIDNNGANNEGVEISASDIAVSVSGWVETGTSRAAYTRASVTIASVSGTDNLYFGWKLAAAVVDNNVLETIDTGGFYHVNDTAGNIEIQTADDGTDADDEDDQVVTWADAETHVLEVRVSEAGVFTFFIDGLASTISTATGAAAAGDLLVPVLGLLLASDADPEVNVNWWEVGYLNDTSEF
jgi:hypothetical protein